MRKKVYIFSVVIIFIVGLMIYLDWNERNSSFTTPEKALVNLKNSSFEVLKIIDKKVLETNNHAYVFFYSQINEPKDYYGVSEFEKGKYGWQFVDMFGGGHIVKDNTNGGLSVGDVESGEYYGLATSNVSTVKLGHLEAELIPLDEKDMKIWIFFNPTSEDMESKLEFFDKDENLLN
jgi:hypothetical protein